MTPPIWPPEDDIGQKRKQKTIEIKSAFQRRDSNEGATTGTAAIDDESALDVDESKAELPNHEIIWKSNSHQ